MPATTTIHAGRCEAGSLGDHPVNAGHAHVVQAVNLVAHEFGSQGGLFGDWQVRGARRRHENHAATRRAVALLERDQSGVGMEDGVGHDLAHRRVRR